MKILKIEPLFVNVSEKSNWTFFRMVTDEDQIMLITSGGTVIRLRVNEIRVIGRNTQGVRLIDLSGGERVSSVARLAEREDDGDGSDAAPPETPPETV